jgi:hypothetical protein
MSDAADAARALVDTDRYPIDRMGSPERDQLVKQCRADLDAGALCFLPNFLRPEALAQMSGEVEALEPVSRRIAHRRTAYGWMDNSGFAQTHPRSALFDRGMSCITTELVPPQSHIRTLFMWDYLTQFVGDALGVASMYRSECPTLSIQLNVMHEHDVLGWHFDTNDGVVSLLVDSADEGGEYQVAPYVRSETDENYDDVVKAFNEDRSVVHEPKMPAGTFILFKGRRSLHRVSPVGKTSKPRRIVLYSYDEQPNMAFPENSQHRLRNPAPTDYRGAKTPAQATGFSLWDTSAPQ